MAQVIYGNDFKGGCVQIPPSKSAAHRQVLCAALSRGACTLSHVDLSEDIKATVAAAGALGAQVSFDEDAGTLTLDAASLGRQNAVIDCGSLAPPCGFLSPSRLRWGFPPGFWAGEGFPSGLWACMESFFPFTEWISARRGDCPWRFPGG